MGDQSAIIGTLFPALIFALVALFEIARPRRKLRFGRVARWRTGLLLVVTSRFAVWMLAWIIAVPAVGLWADSQGVGVFNILDLSFWVEVFASFILLDFALWLQHLLTHKVPVLWRLHKVHHADPDLDVSKLLLGAYVEIVVGFAAQAAVLRPNIVANRGGNEIACVASMRREP